MKQHTILFMCPDDNTPIGGVKQIYKQVDILNKNNIDARVLHIYSDFKLNWFTHNAKVLYSPRFHLNIKSLLGDPFKKKGLFNKIKRRLKKINPPTEPIVWDEKIILVIPEVYGNIIHKIMPGIKKVIYNQNAYYTFQGFDVNAENIYPYQNPEVLASIVVSEDTKKYLDFSFPEHKVYRHRIGINSEVFKYTPQKQKIISYMPRKLSEDVVQVINILKVRNKYPDWKFVAIDNMPEDKVAEIMQNSAIYLSCNYREGFGLPPAETMACGCLVVGYAGGGGQEYFKEGLNIQVEDRNILQFVEKIESAIDLYENKPNEFTKISFEASQFIKNTYSLENEEVDLMEIWKKILAE